MLLLFATVATLPLLVPRGPGNSAAVDGIAIAFMLAFIATVAVRRRQVRFPAFIPILAIMFVSSVAILFSTGPRTGLLSFVTELYLVMLFWFVASELQGRPDRLRVVAAVWVAAAVFWAGLLVATHFHLLSAGFQKALLQYDVSERSAGAARNPNLAADYLVTSVFVLVASPFPRRRLVRAALVFWLLFAVWTSGSIGALLAALCGVVVLAIGATVRRWGGRGRVALSAAGLVLIGGLMIGALAIPSNVNTTTVSQVAQTDGGGIFSGNLGRLSNSLDSRMHIWSAAWSGGARDILLGVGPGEAQDIVVNGAPLGKSLHNDYLAFLFERGLLGLIALLGLVGLLLRWCSTLVMSGRVRLGGHTWHPAGIAAAVVANLVFALTHETYHFRHLWLLLALAWALQDLLRRRPVEEAAVVVEPALRPELAGVGV